MSAIPNKLVLSNGQAQSLVVVVLFATISLTAILSVFVGYSWDPLMSLVRRRSGSSQHHSRAFFHTQLGAYIASLMVCNAISSIGMMIDSQWAGARAVSVGTLCNTQGILMQIGDTGGAYFTAAIAIHSFNTLVLRNKLAGWICLAVMIFGWLVAVLFAATPTWLRNSVFGPAYGIQEMSCGLSRRWPLLSTGLHLVPLLLVSVVSVIFYTMVFLILRGTLTIKNGLKLNFDRSNRWSMSSVTTVEYQRFIAAVARSMLWYPFAYNFLLLPHVIVDLTQSSGIAVPFQATIFANTTASMLGTANALILCNTLRILRPFLQGNLTVGGSSFTSKGKDADMESFFAGAKSPMGFSPSPKNPEKAHLSKTESKREWTPPPRSVSKPIANVGATVARGFNRISRTVSLKRKGSQTQPNPIMSSTTTVARPITPVAELNAMITVPEPVIRKNHLPATPRLPGASPSLPAPRRDTRSPLIRQPTLTVETREEPIYTTIKLNTPEPPRRALSQKSQAASHRTSASDSLLSMYLSRTPEQDEMEKPALPPKPLSKPRPNPMPLSARPPMTQNSLAPSPLPNLRSARVPADYDTPDRQAFANDWAERVRRGAPTPTTATIKQERRRSRSLDLNAAALPRTPAMQSARTPMFGSSLTAETPRRDASLSAVSARTPTFGARTPSSARRLPATPSRSGSTTPGQYGYL